MAFGRAQGALATDTICCGPPIEHSIEQNLRYTARALRSLSLAAPRPGKRDDAQGLAKRRAVGAAARLSTRPHICLERCDLGVALGEDSLLTGARHVSSSPSRTQPPAGASGVIKGGVAAKTIASLTPFRLGDGAW